MNANQTYNQKAQNIQTLIQQLQDKLTAHQQAQEKSPAHWTHVGDLGHIETELEELVKFIK